MKFHIKFNFNLANSLLTQLQSRLRIGITCKTSQTFKWQPQINLYASTVLSGGERGTAARKLGLRKQIAKLAARFMDSKVINLWIALTFLPIALTIIALNENRRERCEATLHNLCVLEEEEEKEEEAFGSKLKETHKLKSTHTLIDE